MIRILRDLPNLSKKRCACANRYKDDNSGPARPFLRPRLFLNFTTDVLTTNQFSESPMEILGVGGARVCPMAPRGRAILNK